MPFSILRNDITHMHVDAIVNAANEWLRQGGGVCGAIFDAAGTIKLRAACDEIGHCDTGSAVATPAFALPARHIIHTPGPVWRGGSHGEEEALRNCYRSSLRLAYELGDRSIAFPLISSGIYGYPKEAAIEVALDEIRAFLADESHEIDVYLTLFDVGSMRLANGRFGPITALIDDLYTQRSPYRRRIRRERPSTSGTAMSSRPGMLPGATLDDACDLASTNAPAPQSSPLPRSATPPQGTAGTSSPEPKSRGFKPRNPFAPLLHGLKGVGSSATGETYEVRPLEEMLTHVDAGFSQTLLTMIDERNLKDSEVYKRANMSRQHFSKIRNNPGYRPKKATVLALAVALRLTLDDTRLLLERAGFALTHADVRDLIVEYFLARGVWDIYEINLALYTYDQPLLG